MQYQTIVAFVAVACWSVLPVPGFSEQPLSTTGPTMYQQMVQQQQESTQPGRSSQEEAVKTLQAEVERLKADLEQERAAAKEQQATRATQSEEMGKLRQELETSKTALNTTRQNEQQAQKTLEGVRQQLQQLTSESEAMRQRQRAGAEQHAQMMGRLKTIHDQAAQHLQEAVEQKTVAIRHETERLVLELRGDAFFAPGQSGLPPKSVPMLDKIVAFLKPLNDYQVLVEGHADAVPMSPAVQKRWASNWEWSASRAAAVARHFEIKGFPATQLAVIGYGAARPVATNDTEAGRAQNRRVEIVLQPSPAASKSH